MPKVTELWAWVVADTDEDDEGVPAFLGPDGFWGPMIGADRDRALSLKPEAQKIADTLGKPVTLRRSLYLEDVLTVKPRKT